VTNYHIEYAIKILTDYLENRKNQDLSILHIITE